MVDQFPAPAGRINIEQHTNGDGLVGLARHRRASVVSSRSGLRYAHTSFDYSSCFQCISYFR